MQDNFSLWEELFDRGCRFKNVRGFKWRVVLGRFSEGNFRNTIHPLSLKLFYGLDLVARGLVFSQISINIECMHGFSNFQY